MIQSLKESTFVVNDVISESWEVLKKRYIAIAGLCFLLFLTSNTSGVLAFYFNSINTYLNVFMAMLFIFLFFGIQLTLFKHIFQIFDHDKAIHWGDSIPSFKELLFFLSGMLLLLLFSFIAYFVISLLLFPLVYLSVPMRVPVTLTMILTTVLVIWMLIRVAFFPFFIIDQGKSPWESIRMSLAITKGNLVKLLMLLLFFALLNILYLYFSFRELALIATGLSLVNSFIVIPLSSVAIALAYRKMMRDYKGSDDPQIFKSI